MMIFGLVYLLEEIIFDSCVLDIVVRVCVKYARNNVVESIYTNANLQDYKVSYIRLYHRCH